MIRVPSLCTAACVIVGAILGTPELAMSDTIKLKLRSSKPTKTAGDLPERIFKEEAWEAAQTAVIVCDVWDYHHCLNAVRRLEEFAPRLDQVLKAARERGAIVIHAPSDCMPAYIDHPARLRTLQTAPAKPPPPDIQYWCSRLDQETGRYPIDQSDGGEDDDPQEHAEWAAKLKAMGRNPGTPWQKQSALITIDGERDYISDRGDEVWSILEKHGIRNVILTGVHCNMCVIGRPFGLRQMKRNGKNVVLMRDMTDSMYSPKSWPYVDHFTGHDLVVDYVEQQICPTITSDQLLGGEPFCWKADQRKGPAAIPAKSLSGESSIKQHWTTFKTQGDAFQFLLESTDCPVWYRGALRVPEEWYAKGPVSIGFPDGRIRLWLNGVEIKPSPPTAYQRIRFTLPKENVAINDYNLIVVRADHTVETVKSKWEVDLIAGTQRWEVEPHWQIRAGESDRFSNIPLPAKFGMGPDAMLRLKAAK